MYGTLQSQQPNRVYAPSDSEALAAQRQLRNRDPRAAQAPTQYYSQTPSSQQQPQTAMTQNTRYADKPPSVGGPRPGYTTGPTYDPTAVMIPPPLEEGEENINDVNGEVYYGEQIPYVDPDDEVYDEPLPYDEPTAPIIEEGEPFSDEVTAAILEEEEAAAAAAEEAELAADAQHPHDKVTIIAGVDMPSSLPGAAEFLKVYGIKLEDGSYAPNEIALTLHNKGLIFGGNTDAAVVARLKSHDARVHISHAVITKWSNGSDQTLEACLTGLGSGNSEVVNISPHEDDKQRHELHFSHYHARLAKFASTSGLYSAEDIRKHATVVGKVVLIDLDEAPETTQHIARIYESVTGQPAHITPDTNTFTMSPANFELVLAAFSEDTSDIAMPRHARDLALHIKRIPIGEIENAGGADAWIVDSQQLRRQALRIYLEIQVARE